jgi:cysteine desulfuration protein SufE
LIFAMGLPAERQERIRKTLGAIDDPQERLTVALGWKTTLEGLREEERVEENRVQGCVSRVWLAGGMEEGRMRLRVDADSPLVLGLVRMICGIYDGATREEVMGEELVVLEELGIVRNLSPTRQNGLAAVRRAVVKMAEKGRGR